MSTILVEEKHDAVKLEETQTVDGPLDEVKAEETEPEDDGEAEVSDIEFEEVRCPKHGTVLPRKVSQSKANPNRAFYICFLKDTKSNDATYNKNCYFKWEDELLREKAVATPENTLGEVKCPTAHDVVLPRNISQSKENPNRAFYVCDEEDYNSDDEADYDPVKCKYFKWEDELLKKPLTAEENEALSTLGEVICPTHDSALPRKISRTQKNPNRAFYSCSECKYFKWEDDLLKKKMKATTAPKRSAPAGKASGPAKKRQRVSKRTKPAVSTSPPPSAPLSQTAPTSSPLTPPPDSP
ncbi:hypothetical protein C8R43DRAFT_1236686 [Mycena crocata]|nr:hypothetical protein C8R43DRAFT_1236686 [Mycena crocata]